MSDHRNTSTRYRVHLVRAAEIKPSLENAELYGEIDFNGDPALPMLRRSIADKGLEEPLILTRDNFILSGHRRFKIADGVLGMKFIPCRYVNFKRSDIKDMHRLLAEYNPQRVKSVASVLAENFLLRPQSSQQSPPSWNEYQKKLTSSFFEPVSVAGSKFVGAIGKKKAEFLAAAVKVINGLKDFWPLSVRQVHYGLLNDPPLTQTTARNSGRWRYKNDVASYNKLSGLLAAARYSREIPWRCIADATRETREFYGWNNLTEFIESQSRNFLNGYGRHRQEGQPNSVEIILEKNTLIGLVADICENFHVQYTPLRGYGGPSVWHEIEMRWRAKLEQFPDAKLVLIFCTDHDGDGFSLMDDAIRSLRDRHGVRVEAIRAAVTIKQVMEGNLSSNPGKESSTRFAGYVKRTGTNRTWECESLPPEVLRRALHDAILSALNIKQLRAVQKLEAAEQKQLESTRKRIAPALKKVLLGGDL